MRHEHISGQPHGQNIFTTGEVDQAIRRGRRLRAEAVRNAFSRLHLALGPTD